jgi:hypothetical protein
MRGKKGLFDPYKRNFIYWSSTQTLYSVSVAWGTDFGVGIVLGYNKISKRLVRCVRGGSPEQQAVLKRKPESKQSAKSPAGTVTDTSTGLMWQKKPDGRKRIWSVAKRYCRNLTLNSYADWDLPSKNVLVDMRGKKGLFDPYKRNFIYWSSTQTLYSVSVAWGTDFGVGIVLGYNKISKRLVRCVRVMTK